MALLLTAKYTFDAPRCDGITCLEHFWFFTFGRKGWWPEHATPSKLSRCVAPLMLLLSPHEHSTHISASVDVFPVEYILSCPLQFLSPLCTHHFQGKSDICPSSHIVIKREGYAEWWHSGQVTPYLRYLSKSKFFRASKSLPHFKLEQTCQYGNVTTGTSPEKLVRGM